MKFGLFDINQPPCLDAQVLRAVAQRAEAAGFESLWCGEHVVLPDPRVPPSPMEPTDPILDPLVALTFAAAATRTLRLGTGVIILPQRNPLVLAKEVASLDVLSGGRLIFGIGAGYLEPEFRAIGVPLRDHGPRTDEYLAAMRVLWSGPRPTFAGKFVSFSDINAFPRPMQSSGPPVVVGGHSPAALRRAVEQSSGWYAFGRDVEQVAALADALSKLARPEHLGQLEVSVTPPGRGRVDLDTVRRYADIGVHRLILRPPAVATPEQLERFIDDVAARLIGTQA